MALRRPLALGDDGLPQRLQPGDTLPSNAFFSGSAALPTLTLLLLNGTSTFAVTPTVTGDVLAVGECITVTPASALPAGLNIAYALVSAVNQVTVGFSAAAAIFGTSMSWKVCAHR